MTEKRSSPDSAAELIARADKYLNTGSGEYAADIMRDMAEFIRRLPGNEKVEDVEKMARAIGTVLYGAENEGSPDLDSWSLVDVLPAAQAAIDAMRAPVKDNAAQAAPVHEQLLRLADGIADHGSSITYPSRQAANEVRSVVRELAAALRSTEPQAVLPSAVFGDALEEAAQAIFGVLSPGIPYTAEDAFWYRQAVHAAIAKLSAEPQGAVLTEALEFYANPKRYEGPNTSPLPNDPFQPEELVYRLDVTRDCGSIARKALTSLSRPEQG